MREVFKTAGRPSDFTAASSSPGFETAANSVVAMPSLRKRFFSARRSCADSRAAGGGETGTLCAKDGDREKGGIDRAGSADGERADGDAPWHLRNGEERIEAF